MTTAVARVIANAIQDDFRRSADGETFRIERDRVELAAANEQQLTARA